MIETWKKSLFRPVDAAGLVYFRIVFGLLMFWESLVLWSDAPYDYINLKVHFTFLGFEWIKPWPGVGMYVHIGLLAVLSLMIAAGLWYRLSAALFFLGFTYVFLIDKAYFLNHFYLISLVSFLLIFAPAHREFSLDALRHRRPRGATVPSWNLRLLQFQIAVPYFFGGIAKFDPSWLSAEPLKIWLPQRAATHLLGALLNEPWVHYFFSYGGLLFDLLIVPLLFWRRSRPFALFTMVLFHALNATIFTIGVFPWLMIAATFILLRPSDRPLRAFWRKGRSDPGEAAFPVAPKRSLIPAAIAMYVAVQVVIPFHHLLYRGDVNWTAEGSYFSWRMMIRKMDAKAKFTVIDADSGEKLSVFYPHEMLTPFQEQSFARDPDMVLQFARRIAAMMRAAGLEHFRVQADVTASLNGRPARRLIDPTVDLAAEKSGLARKKWVLPLE